MPTYVESPARALVNRGALRLAGGALDDAEALFREAVSVDPDNATAHNNLGYVLACRGEHDEAIDEADLAIGLEPTASAPWGHLGMSRVATGDVDGGLEALARSVRLDPENAFAWEAIGRTFLALGHYEEAVGAFGEAAEARPEDEEVLILLAVSLLACDRSGRRCGRCSTRSRSPPSRPGLGVSSASLRWCAATSAPPGRRSTLHSPSSRGGPRRCSTWGCSTSCSGRVEEARAALRSLAEASSDWSEESVALLAQLG